MKALSSLKPFAQSLGVEHINFFALLLKRLHLSILNGQKRPPSSVSTERYQQILEMSIGNMLWFEDFVRAKTEL